MQHHDEGGWHVYCLDEAVCQARVRERRAAAQARKAAQEDARLALSGCYSVETIVDSIPDEREVIWSDSRLAGSESWYLTPDGTIYYARSSYDDGPHYWRTRATRAQIEAAKAAGLKAGSI
jgi:hypothetical protein